MAGGNDLADLASLAHDYAVSHNVMTALVGVTTSTSVSSNAQYRAFVVIASDSTGNNWAPVCKWMLLPASVTMASSTKLDTTLNTFIYPKFQGSYPLPTITFSLDGVNFTSGYLYQTFYPDGHMDTSASSVTLLLVTNQNKTATTAPKDYYELIFNPMTGTVKINRP